MLTPLDHDPLTFSPQNLCFFSEMAIWCPPNDGPPGAALCCCNFLTTNVLQKSLKNAVEVLASSVWALFARILNYCFVFLTCRICCFRCGRFANLLSHFKPIKNTPQDHLFPSETSKRLRRQHLGSIFYCFLQGSAHGDVP